MDKNPELGVLVLDENPELRPPTPLQVAKTRQFEEWQRQNGQKRVFLVIGISTGGKNAGEWSFGFQLVAKTRVFGHWNFHRWQKRW